MKTHCVDLFGNSLQIIVNEDMASNELLFISDSPIDARTGEILEGEDFEEWVKTHVVKVVNIGLQEPSCSFLSRLRRVFIKIYRSG